MHRSASQNITLTLTQPSHREVLALQTRLRKESPIEQNKTFNSQHALVAMPDAAKGSLLHCCTFAEGLHNPILSMVCTSFHAIWQAERKRGMLTPPNVCVPRDYPTIAEAVANCPEDGVVAAPPTKSKGG